MTPPTSAAPSISAVAWASSLPPPPDRTSRSSRGRPVERRARSSGDALRRHPEDRRRLVERLLSPAKQLDRRGAGDGLDAAYVRGARSLRGDLERPDLRRHAHVRPTAELARDGLDLDHPHLFTVFLPEQRHRPELLRTLTRGLDRADGMAVEDPVVHAVLDGAKLLRRESPAVGEVEPKLVRPDRRAGLPNMAAHDLAKRRVKEMGAGVVARGRVARALVDDEPSALALLQLARLHRHRHRLVVAEAVHVLDAPAARFGLDDARVRDLTAALGVEGALGELREHGPVLTLERADRRIRLSGLVAHESATGTPPPRANATTRPCSPVAAVRARRPHSRPLALLLHQLVEAGVVDGEALFLEELPGEVVGKAKGVVKLEGVLGGDPRGALRPSRAGPAPRAAAFPDRACARSSPLPRPPTHGCSLALARAPGRPRPWSRSTTSAKRPRKGGSRPIERPCWIALLITLRRM